MTKALSASAELIKFGYTDEGGEYVKYKAGKPREKYVASEGGFLRYTRDDGQWVGVPFTIAPSFEGVSGLTYATHPQCFEMVYPEAYLANVYAEGNKAAAARAAESLARKAQG